MRNSTQTKLKFFAVGSALIFYFLFAPFFVIAEQPIVLKPTELEVRILELLSQVKILQTQFASLSGGVAYDFDTNLSLGSVGDDVVALQNRLITEGFLVFPPAVAKGYFGQMTKSAVVKYQIAKGVYASGIVGVLTRASLNSKNPSVPQPTSQLKITPDTLPPVVLGASYYEVLTVDGFSGDEVTWKIVSGSLPQGLALTGFTSACVAIFPVPQECIDRANRERYQVVISGQSQAVGMHNFTLSASGGGVSILKAFALNIPASSSTRP